MRKDKKVSLGLVGLAVLTATALLATTAGSLAWYAYSRNVYFSFVGTSVAKSALLNIGLVDKDEKFTTADLRAYDLTRETHDNQSIIFANTTQGLSTGAIQKYLRYYGHAVDKLFPLTTQARELSDQSELDLYRSPDHSQTVINEPALDYEYVHLPFAFKIIDEDSAYVPNAYVWLTEASVSTAQENIHKALRIYVEGDERNFLMNPSDSSETSGSTKVGGLLDLDGDGTYDYNATTGQEYCYGLFENTPGYSSEKYGIPFDDAPLTNVNDVEDESEASTFLAKHNKDAYVADIATAEPLVAEYETLGTVCPDVEQDGDYSGGIPVASTNRGSKIGYTTMTIFIEGWDHSVIDKAVGYSFNLGLKFEINRIN